MGMKLLEHFMKKNCKKQIKQSLELKKDGKLYVDWNGYSISISIWIDKKYHYIK